MLPSNLNLITGNTVGYNNNILLSNTDVKIVSNKVINKADSHHKKLSVTPPESVRLPGAAHLMKNSDKPIKVADKQKKFAEKNNDEKLAIALLILRAGLIPDHLWYLLTP